MSERSVTGLITVVRHNIRNKLSSSAQGQLPVGQSRVIKRYLLYYVYDCIGHVMISPR